MVAEETNTLAVSHKEKLAYMMQSGKTSVLKIMRRT
jgi:hypothetical protein